MGLRYARGLREESALAIVRERNLQPFASIADLAYRVPELRRNELVLLASIGALNSIGGAANQDVLAQLGPPRRRPGFTAAMRYGRSSGQLALPDLCSMAFPRAILPRRSCR